MFNEKLQSAKDASKNFAARHRTALTIIPTALVTASVVVRMRESALAECYEFIEAHGLTEQFVNSVTPDM